MAGPPRTLRTPALGTVLEPASPWPRRVLPPRRSWPSPAIWWLTCPAPISSVRVARVGTTVRLPGWPAPCGALASHGRDGFYGGEFGRPCCLGGGEYRGRRSGPVSGPVGRTAAASRLRPRPVDRSAPVAGLPHPGRPPGSPSTWPPDDRADPRWPHLIAEAGRVAAFDRPAVLSTAPTAPVCWHRTGSGPPPRSTPIGRSRAAPEPGPAGRPARKWPGTSLSSDGDTTHLCVVDGDGLGISLTQSNALDFGAHLVAGRHRGVPPQPGARFQSRAGHPGRVRPGPPSVPHPVPRSRTTVRRLAGPGHRHHGRRCAAADPPAAAGPAAARRRRPGLGHRRPPDRARRPGAAPFRLWSTPGLGVLVEDDVPPGWVEGLEARGHCVRRTGPLNPVDVGCSQIISVDERPGRPRYRGASDPRSPEGAAIGW